MTTIFANLQAVRERIARAARDAGRDPSAIALIAVSKTWPAACIAEACACGQYAFGESYAQEALEKMRELEHLLRRRDDALSHSAGVASPQAGPLLRPLKWHVDSDRHEDNHTRNDVPSHSAGVASPQAGPLLRPLEWHFIGPVQSNKTRAIAEHFDWVHSVAREKVAQRLNAARPAALPPLNVCIQVNVSGEASKSGIAPGTETALAAVISALPRLRLRGLMAVPEPTSDTELQRRRFALLRQLKERLQSAGFALDTLSMGMSDDFESAILEGATMVRIGTAIFGERPA